MATTPHTTTDLARDRRPRWGCSPFQAMQALAALTGLETPPATTVRLKRSVQKGLSGGR
mgnify:CR=1 FL=1